MRRLRVLHASNLLGLGGTEKTVQILASHMDRAVFDVSVCGVFGGGERVAALRAAGTDVHVADGTREMLTDLFTRLAPDVIHYHRAGREEPLVPTAAREAGVPVLVDHNIFGAVDDSPSARLYDHTLFVSQMTASRYRRKRRLAVAAFGDRHSILYNPIDLAAVQSLRLSEQDRRLLRKELGLPTSSPVVGRVGRAHERKWGRMFPEMLPHLVKQIPEVRCLIIGATPHIKQRIRRLGYDGHCVYLPETADDRRVGELYQIMDCLAHTSRMGESFGLVLAEAMAFGTPVVTHSIPRGDNAQIELVDHGVTGLVANHPRTYAEALALLLLKRAEAVRIAASARAKVERLFAAGVVVPQLERLYLELAAARGVAGAGALLERRKGVPYTPSVHDLEMFEKEYARRLRRALGPLRARERPKVWLEEMRNPYEPWKTHARRLLHRLSLRSPERRGPITARWDDRRMPGRESA